MAEQNGIQIFCEKTIVMTNIKGAPPKFQMKRGNISTVNKL